MIMLWLIIAIAAYFLLAVTNTGDKLLISHVVSDPKEYVFLVGLPLGFLVIFIPFFGWPGPRIALLALAAGFIFNYGLYWLYLSLKNFDSSQAVPAISGLVPVFTTLLSFLFLGEIINWYQGSAIILLVLGSVLISLSSKFRLDKKALAYAAIAAFLFAAAFVLSREVFRASGSFWQALLWIKFGGFFVSLAIGAFWPQVLKGLIGRPTANAQKGFWLYLNQFVGIIANILQNFSIWLSSGIAIALPVINALQGVQYIFIMLFAWILRRRFPKQMEEDFSSRALLRKISGLVLLCSGLIIFASLT